MYQLESHHPSNDGCLCLSEGNLERALQQKTGISEDAIIAYLPDGRRLTTENIRELAGAEDDVSLQAL